MASVQPWKKPDLEGRRPILKMLNDGLHELRLDAGLPSARTIYEGIGKDPQGYWIMNHQAVLDTFQQPDLPRLGRLELIVAALSESAGRSNTGTEAEVDRFKELWKQAYNELVAQSSVQPPGDAAAQDGPAVDGTEEVGDTDEGQHRGHRSSPRAEEPSGSGQDTARFNYAQESLKGLIINAAQALWDDKDALRVFLGVMRRSEGFIRMADALAERPPANACCGPGRAGPWSRSGKPTVHHRTSACRGAVKRALVASLVVTPRAALGLGHAAHIGTHLVGQGVAGQRTPGAGREGRRHPAHVGRDVAAPSAQHPAAPQPVRHLLRQGPPREQTRGGRLGRRAARGHGRQEVVRSGKVPAPKTGA
ncbi:MULTISPECIES: hypothetical protein [Streptomyces]|uniref:hypothetical protein n=1 Tax=Streptomyces lycopersici TaxID=2974589 RepID=UPI0021D322F6|nr:hypothetical protein [Streptomyces sp. NEAU-383]